MLRLTMGFLGTHPIVIVRETCTYLGTVLFKQGNMEGEIRVRTIKGRQVMGALERVMKGRNVSMTVKKGISNSVILPTLSYAAKTWTWNAAQ